MMWRNNKNKLTLCEGLSESNYNFFCLHATSWSLPQVNLEPNFAAPVKKLWHLEKNDGPTLNIWWWRRGAAGSIPHSWGGGGKGAMPTQASSWERSISKQEQIQYGAARTAAWTFTSASHWTATLATSRKRRPDRLSAHVGAFKPQQTKTLSVASNAFYIHIYELTVHLKIATKRLT